MTRSVWARRLLLFALALCSIFAGGAVRIVQDQCGPFTDVSPAFCPFVSELYYLGITAGTSATTFSPDDPLTRGQGAVFIAKGLNQSLARSSRRAALGQWWTTTPQYGNGLGTTPLGSLPFYVASDGADLWVTDEMDGTVSRVHASDGRLLGTWTGASGARGVLVAMGRIFVVGGQNPGNLYMIDPSVPAGAVTTVSSDLGPIPYALAFDGSRIWVANNGGPISIVTPGPTLPWTVSTFQTSVLNPLGVVFDGNNIWMTDGGNQVLTKFDAAGNVIQTVQIGFGVFPVFDGTNIWVPLSTAGSVAVVRASTGALVQNLTGNGLNSPYSAAFDGERILVTNYVRTASPLEGGRFSAAGHHLDRRGIISVRRV